ncbi:MAG: cytidylate kinase-like family protein [Eubacteriales bacterium]|nr:cytidylate kinase-like family protein [Eubacteriales bacterium]
MSRIITIGREFGSGGRELGRRLAEELGYAYYDQEIVTEIAQRTALSEAYVRQILEHKPVTAFPIRIGRTFTTVVNSQQEQWNDIFKQQYQILRELADTADCVIVGRCADWMLRAYQPFRIFVYADMEHRMQRCRQKGAEHEAMTDKELRQHIQEVDKHRASYYGYCTDQKWGDKANYDLCINTGLESVKEIAHHVAQYLKAWR